MRSSNGRRLIQPIKLLRVLDHLGRYRSSDITAIFWLRSARLSQFHQVEVINFTTKNSLPKRRSMRLRLSFRYLRLRFYDRVGFVLPIDLPASSVWAQILPPRSYRLAWRPAHGELPDPDPLLQTAAKVGDLIKRGANKPSNVIQATTSRRTSGGA